MANENFKNALRRAGLTVEQFAEIITVDPKTVQRWSAGRTPYPRHRQTISRALDIPEHQLWPDTTPTPDTNPAERKESAAGDVTGSWPHSTHPTAPDPLALIADAAEQIDMLDDTGALLRTPGLIAALHDRAFDGCDIRVLTLKPANELGGLSGSENVKPTPGSTAAFSLVRVDDDMLLALPLAGAESAPLLHLRRLSDDGLFVRLTEHFQTLWTQAEISFNKPQAAAPKFSPAPTQPTTPAGARTEEVPPAPASNEPAPRRWPRRPNNPP